jgi:hypothetical protein
MEIRTVPERPGSGLAAWSWVSSAKGGSGRSAAMGKAPEHRSPPHTAQVRAASTLIQPGPNPVWKAFKQRRRAKLANVHL